MNANAALHSCVTLTLACIAPLIGSADFVGSYEGYTVAGSSTPDPPWQVPKSPADFGSGLSLVSELVSR
jgi:hypothetical protein